MSLHVDIHKSLGDFSLDVNVDAQTETLGFLGASGCGKSLTLRCVAGIETPDEGRIVVNDTVFFDSAAKVNLSPQQRKTALLFQNYRLFPNMTIEANVAAGIPKNVSKGERDAIVAAELKRFSLEGFNKRYPAQLSGGQQQRVALARMLAARPGILMLDEPFSALDGHLRWELEMELTDTLRSFPGGALYVSHNRDEVYRMCDTVCVIDRGRSEEKLTVGTADGSMPQLEYQLETAPFLYAPVSAGQSAGTWRAMLNGREVAHGKLCAAETVAYRQPVEKRTAHRAFPARIWKRIQSFFQK